MAADADPNAAYLANRRSGESIQQTLARMEAVRAAQLEADARQAAENEKTWFNFWKGTEWTPINPWQKWMSIK